MVDFQQQPVILMSWLLVIGPVYSFSHITTTGEIQPLTPKPTGKGGDSTHNECENRFTHTHTQLNQNPYLLNFNHNRQTT